jgi:hypothetical protein
MIWPQLIMWVVSFLLTDYFRERLPSQTASGIGDFNIPTATEGRPVPIITGGTVRCDAPNCIWYGDFVAVPRTTSTGIVFKRDEVIGYVYELSMQYALFKGESVGITAIYIGDEKVFDMDTEAGGIPQEFWDVDKPDLFGGKDQGGGFEGRVRLHKGQETQPVSAFLATHPDLDPLPAYRGLSYIVITNMETQVINDWLIETIPAETKGANFGEANQIRYVRVEVQTFDDLAGTAGSPGLGDTLALGNDHHFIGPDINPIIVAWDLWTNTRWGRGFGLSDVNLADFQAAAEICWTEGLGWTNLIDEQTTTGKIQDIIEQHIDGYIGPNPVTGLIEVTLARPDYVVAALPLVDDNNLLEVKEWSQGDWSNTKNRVRIRYTSRSKNWKETHAVETAAGNRIIQGRTVTTEIRYEGCHTDAVASIIASREKRGYSIPLQKGTIVVDRTGYTFKPGAPFRITSDQTKTTDLPVRVTRIAYGDMIRQSIELSVVEDIFGNEPSTVEVTPPESDFVPPIQAVIPFTTDSQAALEPPFLLMQYDSLPGVTGRIATMARRNQGNRPTEYATLQRNSAGVPAGAYTSLTPNINGGFSAVGTLRNAELAGQPGNGALTIQVDPFVQESLDGIIGSYDPRFDDPQGIAVISPGLADEEFIVFRNVVDSGAGIELQDLWRSGFDTPWKSHLAGAGVWFIWTGGFGMNETQTYALARNVELKLLPVSPNSQVLEAAATPLPIVTMDTATGDRTTKPLLPVILEIPLGDVFPTTVNFDGTIVPQTGPNYTGSQVVPLHRLASNPDPQNSVQGFTLAGIPAVTADFADQVLDLSLWIHDLDQDPGASRANAVFTVLNQAVVDPDDEIQLPKTGLVAGGAIGIQFNARLEIETRDSRPSSPALNISHEPLFHDFLATGIFTLDANQVVLGSQFNGQDGDTGGVDSLARPTLYVGAAEIDEASSEYGGSSLIFDGIDSAVHLASGIGFDWYDGEFTIDFRIRFDDVASLQVIMGQAWIAPGRTWYLQWTPNSFQLSFSRTGSNGPFTNIQLGSFTPVAATWYTMRIVQAKKPSSPRFSAYIDGTRIGSTFTAQSHTDSGHDWILGALHTGGNNYSNFFTGQIDELEVRPFAAIDPDLTTYTLDTERPALGSAGELDALIANFNDVDTATDHRTDETSRWDLTFGATSEIDTAQFMFGTSSLRCDGVDSLTPSVSDGVWLPATVFPTSPSRAWDLKRRDWTMEAFVRFNALPSTKTDGMAILGKYNRPSGNQVDWGFTFTPGDDLNFYFSTNGNITGGVSISSSDLGVLSTGVWYHVAAQRRGQDMELYFEGNRVLQSIAWFDGVAADFIFNQVSNPVTIGRFYDVSSVSRVRALNGWIDAVNVRLDECFYSGATYTIPTAPRTPGDRGDRDLLLLHHFDGGDFFATDRQQETDDGQRSTRITFISGGRYLDANPKFGVTHGDAGVDDGLAFTESKFWWRLDDSDFTIDIWFQNNDTEAQQANNGVAFFNHWLESGDNRAWRLSFDKSTGELEFVWTTDGTTGDERRAFLAITYDSVFQDNATYVHVAVERDGGVINIYLDGVIQTLDGASDIIGADVIYHVPQRAIQVGIENEVGGNKTANGYWDEFRFTKRAEYGSSSFTPETSAYVPPVFPNI